MQEPAATNRRCVVIGNGRAGGSFASAMAEVGWHTTVWGRADSLADVTRIADLVLIATPDDEIRSVAGQLPTGPAVVAHCSGSRTLEELEPHEHTGSIHPLMSLPDPVVGAARLLDHCTFAVDGNPLMEQVVADLGGRSARVSAGERGRYHAAATVAANHLTALCDQVQTLANEVGVPTEAFWTLMQTTLDNVRQVGPTAALTGPAARGDWRTLAHHLDQLPENERRLYLVLSRRAATMAGHTWPEDLL